jgi:Ca2+/H+ antiporter, TMEM165/GDT1 family
LQQGNFFKDDKTTPEPSLRDVGFIHAFVASLSVIIVSELGDKTFFIAAIMAMRHPRITVFAGAIGALALMTVLSGTYWKFICGSIFIL